jgi:glycosyltransferase involved in cell wall biosynthesis
MISIIIPARNEEKNIIDILNSIKQNHYKKNYEVIVVDGKSEDNTQDIARKMRAKVIEQTGKLGVGNARNVGWKNAKGDVIIFVEADHILDENFLSEVDKTFLNKNVVAARPRTKLLVKNNFQRIFEVQVKMSERRQRVWEFPIIFKKSVLEKTGGYDEKLSFGEDREFPHRIKKMKINSVLIKKAILYVKPIDSFKKLWGQGFWYGKNIISYTKKTQDYLVLIGVLVNSLALPFLILGFLNNIFFYLSGILFILLFLRAFWGFLYTKKNFAWLLPLIWTVRGMASLTGIIISPFTKHRGR